MEDLDSYTFDVALWPVFPESLPVVSLVKSCCRLDAIEEVMKSHKLTRLEYAAARVVESPFIARYGSLFFDTNDVLQATLLSLS